MTKNNNYKVFLYKALTTGVLLLSVIFVFGQTALGQTADEQAALNELSQLTGQSLTTIEQAAEGCSKPENFDICYQAGIKYNLYKTEEIAQVNTVFKELKDGGIIKELELCANEDCFIGAAKNFAGGISEKLVVQLGLTPEEIARKEQIIAAAQIAGVDFEVCKNMNPNDLNTSESLIRRCAELAGNIGVEFDIDTTLKLRKALAGGEYQCGDNTLDGCGNFCLNPSKEAKTEGTAAIPDVCYKIARNIFGEKGVERLESAYSQASQVEAYHSYKLDNLTFTTIDGQTLTNPEDIGRYMEEKGKEGDIDAITNGMDFMIANGFVKPEDKDFVLSMMKKFKEKGGMPDFNTCSQNPEACQEFIPEEHKGQFEIYKTMKNQLGFPPEECQKPENQQKCFEAARGAIGEIGSLGAGAQSFTLDIKGNIERYEDLKRLKNEVLIQGGPGGCKSETECVTYCNDPKHGAECIAFGASAGIHGYEGRGAIEKFQEFHQSFQFEGVGAFPNFIPPGQGGTPPGQIPGFTEPGPGFTPPPGCAVALQSGNFEKAKVECAAFMPQGAAISGTQPSQGQSQPSKTGICPAAPYIPCPAGTYERTYTNQDGCSIQQCISADNGQTQSDPAKYCAEKGGAWDPKANYCQMPPTTGTTNTSGGTTSGGAYDTQNGSSSHTEDPATACAKSGGSWNGTVCTFSKTRPASFIGALLEIFKSLFGF